MATLASRVRLLLAALLVVAALAAVPAAPSEGLVAAPQVTRAEYGALRLHMPRSRAFRVVGSRGEVTDSLPQCQARRYTGWGGRTVYLVFTRLNTRRWRLWATYAFRGPRTTGCTS